MVVIVDYGLGNLRSVAGAVEKIGHTPRISSRPEEIEAAEKLILPGVGAFGDGMRNLQERGLVAPLTQAIRGRGVPILGICLGSQLMAKESFEFGHHEGLGWIDAAVVRIEPNGAGLKVPHVGWNELIDRRSSVLFDEVPEDALFYYVHSYHVRCADDSVVIGRCEYGGRFTAAVQSGNIFATQFHPEKSQRHGLKLLQNFLEKT